MNTQRLAQNTLINRLQTLSLLFFIGGYLALVGWLIWGGAGFAWLLLFGGIFFFFAPTASPHLVMRLHKARPLSRPEALEIYQILDGLSQRARLPDRPVLYYLPKAMCNAFAVGTRRQAALAVTDGLLKTLTHRELTGVLAHEISHINNNDIRVMSLADMASRLTGILSLLGQVLLIVNLPLVLFYDLHINWLAVLALLFAPQFSTLAQLGLSRVREYDADLNAARLTGDPEGLALALAKLEEQQKSFWKKVLVPAGYRIPEISLLRTHPPTEERVRRLMALKQTIDDPEIAMTSHASPTLHTAVYRQGWSPRWYLGGLWH